MNLVAFRMKIVGMGLTTLLWLGSGYALASTFDDLGGRLAEVLRLIETDPSKAATQLEQLGSDSDPVADYVAYLHALALQRAELSAQAREAFRLVLERWPDSPIAPRAAAKLAPLLLTQRDTKAAVSLAEKYVRNASAPGDAAALALAAGTALADSERIRAAEWLLRARQLAPGTAVGAQAASLLSDLRHLEPSLRPRSARALLEEAQLAARERDTELERAMLDRLLASYSDDAYTVDAALLRAKLIITEKGRLDAAAWLERRASQARTKSGSARLLYTAAVNRWNADDTEAARGLFERVVQRAADGAEAQQSHYSLGRIAEGAGQYAAAAAEYRAASIGPNAQVARESCWRTGWSAYLASDYQSAAQRFADAAKKAGDDGPSREQALYWQARALERAGHRFAAEDIYRNLVASFPDGFYALLIEQRIGITAPPPLVNAIEPAQRTQYPSLFLGLDRARVLEAAGLHDFSTEEIRRVRSTSNSAAARALLPELLTIDAPDQALRTALSLYNSGALRETELYPYLYPHPFASIVEREAKARDLEPALVYSLMRQESLFDRRAVSPAAAYGLMQLLVSTARRMAAKEADTPHISAQELFQPEINIRLGTAYLAELARRFDRDPALILAGYNAGEQAAERWRTKLVGLDRDEFIEQISYRETRDYVKKVLRNYRNYRRLYGGLTDTLPDGVEKPTG